MPHEIAPEDQWPACYYGPDGQSEIFNSPLEVPEGWHDNPTKVGDPKAKTVIPGYDEAVAAANAKAVAAANAKAGDLEDSSEKRDLDADDEAQRAGEDLIFDGDTHADPKIGENSNVPDEVINTGLHGAEGQDSHPEQLAPFDQMEKEDIIGRLTSKKVNFNPSWSAKRLYELLKDHLNEGGNHL